VIVVKCCEQASFFHDAACPCAGVISPTPHLALSVWNEAKPENNSLMMFVVSLNLPVTLNYAAEIGRLLLGFM
jgi:hypothetical protein